MQRAHSMRLRRSEVKLPRHLYLARIVDRAADLAEGARRPYARRRSSQVRMVERVEELETEFKLAYLGELKLLEDAQIFVVTPRARIGTWTARSEGPSC